MFVYNVFYHIFCLTFYVNVLKLFSRRYKINDVSVMFHVMFKNIFKVLVIRLWAILLARIIKV